LINPEDATIALMVKWLVKAMEPGTSNLHIMLRYRLKLYQPYGGGNWQPSLDYFTIKGHQCKQGSLEWTRAIAAWKLLLPELQFVPLKCLEDLHSCNFWFCPGASPIGPGFSKARAAALVKVGLQKYRDSMVDD
jgi:hypothetical protein